MIARAIVLAATVLAWVPAIFLFFISGHAFALLLPVMGFCPLPDRSGDPGYCQSCAYGCLRVIGVDFILGKRSGRVPIPTFCVEQSRWHRRGSESDKVFCASPSYLSSKSVKLGTKVSASQAQAWSSVASEQQKLSNAVGSDVAAQEFYSIVKKPDGYLRALQPAYYRDNEHRRSFHRLA
jgi:hypothetical protein